MFFHRKHRLTLQEWEIYDFYIPKYEEIIEEVRSLSPNEYEDSQMLKWLEELEGQMSFYGNSDSN